MVDDLTDLMAEYNRPISRVNTLNTNSFVRNFFFLYDQIIKITIVKKENKKLGFIPKTAKTSETKRYVKSPKQYLSLGLLSLLLISKLVTQHSL